MGRLVDGQWHTDSVHLDADGRFRRPTTRFRRWIRAADERCGPAAGRYHLYVSLACPWAHRASIMRVLKGLDHAIEVSVVEHFMSDQGWRFDPNIPGATVDKVLGREWLRDVYLTADSHYTGQVTVPVLWDIREQTIVNNESREIVRMFDHEFVGVARNAVDFAPPALLDEVERVIDAIYEPINNGVYLAGFASSQRAYDEAVEELFAALDHWDDVLGRQRWLAGDRMTEADIFLFTTLIRFDLVYHTHFKCNRRRIVDYPNLAGFVRELYQIPSIAKTCDFEHIRHHYYASHETINPRRIVAVGPRMDLELARPHGRERVGGLSAIELLS
jgi:putative glutathione S-transferase